jgi:hypothetical protein
MSVSPRSRDRLRLLNRFGTERPGDRLSVGSIGRPLAVIRASTETQRSALQRVFCWNCRFWNREAAPGVPKTAAQTHELLHNRFPECPETHEKHSEPFVSHDNTTTYARLGHFVIGRSEIQVRWSAPFIHAFLCLALPVQTVRAYFASRTQRNPTVPERSILGDISSSFPCLCSRYAWGKYHMEPCGW